MMYAIAILYLSIYSVCKVLTIIQVKDGRGITILFSIPCIFISLTIYRYLYIYVTYIFRTNNSNGDARAFRLRRNRVLSSQATATRRSTKCAPEVLLWVYNNYIRYYIIFLLSRISNLNSIIIIAYTICYSQLDKLLYLYTP